MTARGALSSALTEDSYYTSGSAGCTQSLRTASTHHIPHWPAAISGKRRTS